MRVYVNVRTRRGAYGGANAFLRALFDELRGRGVEIVHDLSAPPDVALLNALTGGIDLELVRLVAASAPVVHRKTGFRVSGTDEQRRVEENGVVAADRTQVEFGPHLAHSVFQSEYSRGVFRLAGFDGPHTVIHNGVDERVFNTCVRRGPLRRAVTRDWWDGSTPIRVVVSTWSADERKGFAGYRLIDEQVEGRSDVELRLVGRVPEGTCFRNIRVLRPRGRERVAAVLRDSHVLLTLSEHETCSNAIIEGINCGLPVIYLDSGANAELAAPYGVPFDGSFVDALDRIRSDYRELADRTRDNPYRIGNVAPRYLDVLAGAAA